MKIQQPLKIFIYWWKIKILLKIKKVFNARVPQQGRMKHKFVIEIFINWLINIQALSLLIGILVCPPVESGQRMLQQVSQRQSNYVINEDVSEFLQLVLRQCTIQTEFN